MNMVQKFFRNNKAEIVNAFCSLYSLINPVSDPFYNGVLA